jgi:glucose-1-phosphate thymidylyltransferase
MRKITDLEEKPQNPKSNFALAAVYVLDKGVIDYIGNTGNNIELTDALRAYMLAGNEINGMLLRKGQWLSVGTAESYAGVLKSTFNWTQRMLRNNPG